MAVTPNFEQAELNVVKLRDYCLNADHPRGKHKARVLLAALEIGPDNADWLKTEILKMVLTCDPEKIKTDTYGTRWRADLTVERQGRSAVLRTGWLTKPESDKPIFMSCWVK